MAVRYAVFVFTGALAALVVGCERPHARVDTPAVAAETTAPAADVPAVNPAPPPPRDTLWLLARDPVRDAVHATDTEADLIRRYGAQNVRRDSIALGEGTFATGTVLFPDDTLRRLELLWEDTLAFRGAIRAGIGSATSLWVVFPGVSMGTSLADLQRLNGRPFSLFGFGFDYSGTVDSWRGGRLDAVWNQGKSYGKRVVVRLEPTRSVPDSTFLSVTGERVFDSTHPAMVALAPRVYDLFIRPR